MSGQRSTKPDFIRFFLLLVLISMALPLRAFDNSILRAFPEEKQQEFIGRKWTPQDSALRLVREEGLRATSVVTMMVAGRLVVNAIVPVLTSSSQNSFMGWLGLQRVAAPLATWGVQSAMDYSTSASLEDFYLRSGSNFLNMIVPGESQSFWRQGVTFILGHLALANSYWPEIRMQLRNQHGGIRRIRFMSRALDQLVDLELIAPQGSGDESAQLVMHFETTESFSGQISSSMGLASEWLELADVCRAHSVTSIRIRPSSKGMFVQLWRDDRMLSETTLAVATDSGVSKLWLTDFLIGKHWPEGRRLGQESVINPLTAPVLTAVKALITEGDEASVVIVRHLPSAVSPRGRLAVFSTGASGYLFVDRNRTADVELPELWLNTEQPFEDNMKISLARLEEQQEPGHWRGIQGLGTEVAKSYITRAMLYGGLNWLRKDPLVHDPNKLPNMMYSDMKASRVPLPTITNTFTINAAKDSSGNIMLPPSIWAQADQYKSVTRPQLGLDVRPVTEQEFRNLNQMRFTGSK